MHAFSEQQIQAFDQDGFVITRGLLDEQQAELLRRVARADRYLQQQRASRADGEGGAVELVVENHLSERTIYGSIVRSERIVRPMEQLLRDEVYHYHHKMILKEPREGGAWAWHQDYGYWYDNACLYPTMASCMIAVDSADRSNGCLQVLRGSQQIGRINHQEVGDQTGADPERVEIACRNHELVYVELQSGDAVFFHANLLHRSDQNRSDRPRWAFICCYNTKQNSPFRPSRHPDYSPLDVWPHVRVQETGIQQLQELDQHSSSD